MDLTYQAVANAAATGEQSTLLTIVARQGSAPRGAGASMAVTADGKQTGTIGGGSVEYEAKLDALARMKTGEGPMLREYSLYAGESKGNEMECGGRVTVLFRPFSGDSAVRLFRSVQKVQSGAEEAWLVCKITGGVPGETKICQKAQAQNEPALLSHLNENVVFTSEANGYFIEPLCAAPRVIVFGGGHVSQKTVPVLSSLGYRVWVVEDRAEFACEALFPSAERILNESFECAADTLGITRRDHVIVLARGHETDYRILREILKTDADYIGCIGSKAKVKLTRERLIADGFTKDDMARLHSPIGLDIGAETPAEIAVSIAAEMIAHCAARKRCGGDGEN